MHLQIDAEGKIAGQAGRQTHEIKKQKTIKLKKKKKKTISEITGKVADNLNSTSRIHEEEN